MSVLEKFLMGHRCALGPLQEEQLPPHVGYLNDPEVHRFLRIRPPFSLDQQSSWLNRMRLSETDFVAGIYTKDPENDSVTFVGVNGLHNIDLVDQTAWSGTVIGDKRYWGHGIARESKLLQLGHAFNVLKLRWVWSSAVRENHRSRRFLRKAGYIQLGTHPQSRLIEGAYCDELLLGISREKWQKISARVRIARRPPL